RPQLIAIVVEPFRLPGIGDVFRQADTLATNVHRAFADGEIAAGVAGYAGNSVAIVGRAAGANHVDGFQTQILSGDLLRLVDVGFERDTALLRHHRAVLTCGVVGYSCAITRHVVPRDAMNSRNVDPDRHLADRHELGEFLVETTTLERNGL